MPDLVIEIVSNKEGGELSSKRDGYLERHVPFYVVFDPELYLSERQLRCFEYSPSGYVEMVQPFFSLLDLGLTLWKGEYETYETTWLRWCNAERSLLPTGKESTLVEKARADEEKARADVEKARADQVAADNARLLERLREAGLEPG